MKINCDYCGAQIDTDRYDTCPNCGAGFDRDRELMKEKEKLDKADDLLLEQRRLEIERLRLENEKLRQSGEPTKKGVPAGCMVVLGALAALGVLFIVIMCFAFAEADDSAEAAASGTVKSASPLESISITIDPAPVSIPEIPDFSEWDINAATAE